MSAGERAARKRQGAAEVKRGYVRLALRIVLLAAVGYVLFAHVILIARASGNGMFPAVKDGDLIVAFRLQSDTCWAITARRRRTAELSALFRWNTWKGRPLPLSVDGVCNPPPRKSMTEAKKEEKKEATMKIAKRVIPLIAAFALALCMGAVAFAAEQLPEDKASVDIGKTYRLVGDGSSPAEIFTLEQVGDGVVKDGEATFAPALGTITGAEFEAGAAVAAPTTRSLVNVALPTYEKVGVYEYTLKEVAGTNAGVTYHGETIKLVVTVINDPEGGFIRIPAVHTETTGDKSDTFENTYSAGVLNITKTVAGKLGDKTKYFEFKVTLTGEEGKTYAENFAVEGGSYENNPARIALGVETTFTLKDGEIDMGVVLDSLPYVATLAVVVLGAVALVARKRRANK